MASKLQRKKIRLMADNIEVNQKVVLGFGNTIIGAQFNGLSDSEIVDLAERTAKETISGFADPKDFLRLFFVASSIVPASHVSPSYIYTFEFLVPEGKECTSRWKKYIFTLKKAHNDSSSSVKCSISDIEGNNLKLYTQFGSFGVLPQSIHKWLELNGQGQTEVVFEPNQIVIGKTEDGDVVLTSIGQEHPWYYLPVKVAVYVPFEVIP